MDPFCCRYTRIGGDNVCGYDSGHNCRRFGKSGFRPYVSRGFSGHVWLSVPDLPLSMVGYYNAYKSLFRNGDDKVTSNMFSYTFKGYPKALGLSILYMLFVFLWALLLYIPGIIKGLAYSMSPFILKDNPELSANQAINLSMKMMKGHKFDLFFLMLSFIGWGILAIFTFGIGYLWLAPYMSTTMVAFYEDVKAEYEAQPVAA
ncbi:MAG: DUF975 family protein [Bacteroidales bacterium]|nr:DUF975 family protein [Bacteroidales bacterium]